MIPAQRSTKPAPAVRNSYKILQIHQELDHLPNQ